MGRVQDQVAVVTGAAKGLGEAIALRLAEDGAKLVLGDIDGQGLASTAAAPKNTFVAFPSRSTYDSPARVA